MISSSIVSVSTSATELVTADHPCRVFLDDETGGALRLGGTGVTLSDAVAPGAVISAGGLELNTGDSLWGILTTGGPSPVGVFVISK